MESKDLKLLKKLGVAQAEIERCPKNGYNKFHRYEYATESDVSDHIRPILAKHGLTIIPSVVGVQDFTRETNNGKVYRITRVEMQVTVTDGEGSYTTTWFGEGEDEGDKAIFKATTGAMKYALLKLFNLSSGEDPEADGREPEPKKSYSQPRYNSPPPKPKPKASPKQELPSPDEVFRTPKSDDPPPMKGPDSKISPGQIKDLWALARAEPKIADESVKMLLTSHGYDGTAQVLIKDYDEILADIADMKEQVPS